MTRRIGPGLLALVLLATVASRAAEPEAPAFARPERLRFDGQCLTIEGRDTFVFSGAFHYFRCPRELWRQRFAMIRDAGCNAVETYVPWNYHERQPPPGGLGDFSQVDLGELAAWLKMAHEEFGLYTIIRPGPYICAEWANGAFPNWLLPLKPAKAPAAWLRSDDPAFLAWCKHWYDACVPLIAREQVTRKPAGQAGVILFQIENEYDLIPGFSEAQRQNHLKALARMARANGIEVPLFTCVTKQTRGSRDPELAGIFDAVNSYPRWNIASTGDQLEAWRRAQPGAPGMVAELQGGWFSGIGGKLSEDEDGLAAAQCHGITMMAIAHGATILNYYMLFGGTNFGDWGGRKMTTSYDYFAPIREHGGGGEKYAAVKAIGAMLKELGPAIARTQRLEAKVEGAAKDLDVVVRRAGDGQTLVFCWNRSRQALAEGEAALRLAGDPQPVKLAYRLEPFAFRMLCLPPGEHDSAKGRWLPQAVPIPARSPVPAARQIATATCAADPAPQTWLDVPPGQSLAAQGVYDSRYVLYRSRVSLNPEQAKDFWTLHLRQESDNPVLVRVNGQFVGATRYANGVTTVDAGPALRAGENEIAVLFENLGYPNFGSTVGQPAGITAGALVRSRFPEAAIAHWRVRLAAAGTAAEALTGPAVDDSGWDQLVLDATAVRELAQPVQPGAEAKNAAARILFGKRNATAVYRADLELTAQALEAGQTSLVFERIDDAGTVYVNGRKAGEARDYRTPLRLDAKPFLKPGRNLVAVVVANNDGDGGLTLGVSLPGAGTERVELQWQLAPQLGGVAAGWPERAGDATAWRQVALGAAPAPQSGEAFATWYRLEFELPEPAAKVWLPWRAKLEATGNGMIYLNGRHLGRYWQAGPQRWYYLPESWLRFGAGQKNVLTLCLRRMEREAVLHPVEVAPYPDAGAQR